MNPELQQTSPSPLGNKSRLRSQGFLNLYRKPVFAALAALLVVHLVFAPDPWVLAPSAVWVCQVAGMMLVFAGIVGRTFSTLSIGGRKDREIVTTEMYSVCRNPLYFASFLMALGLGLLSARVDFLALIALTYLAIFQPMMRNEARFLRERFAEYAEYERRVPLFVPDFRLWEERRRFQIDFKLVRRTLLEAMIVLPVVPVVMLVRSLTH